MALIVTLALCQVKSTYMLAQIYEAHHVRKLVDLQLWCGHTCWPAEGARTLDAGHPDLGSPHTSLHG
jgi:hypothetical protein